MYFNILSGRKLFLEGNDELKYDFEYITKDMAEPQSGAFWVLLKDIVMSNKDVTDIKYQILAKMKEKITIDQSIERTVEKNVSRIKNLFTERNLIYYYNIDTFQDEGEIQGETKEEKTRKLYEEILEIFIRTNSGGTILSKSDLMFSLMKLKWDNAEEQFEDLLETLNENGLYDFDKDFILKAALVLIGEKAQYRIGKFKGEEGTKNLETIRDCWSKILNSFQYLDDFLVYSKITSKSMLPSYNALIPIIYFAYKYDCKIDSHKVRRNMQTWLYKTLLNSDFSGQSDTVIDTCIETIKANSRIDYFPYVELETIMKSKGRIDNDTLDGNHLLILNLIYLYNNKEVNFQPKLKGNSPQTDHIFPKSKMITDKHPSQLINNLGNYMILESSLNIKKTNIMPDVYFPEALKQQPDFYIRNIIPNDPSLHKSEKFPEFVAERKRLIFETLKQVLSYQI